MAYERTSGLAALLVTPTRKGTFLFGTLSGQLIMSLIQMALLIGFGVIVIWALGPESPGADTDSGRFWLAGVAMGACWARSSAPTARPAISASCSAILALLGGCWWPRWDCSQASRTAVKVLPTTWAATGVDQHHPARTGIDQCGAGSARSAGFCGSILPIGV
ncbi:MAG: ABC transporter permease [Chloroflexota bacterium]